MPFTNPVLIDEEDGIIAGHGRVLGAHSREAAEKKAAAEAVPRHPAT